MYGAVVVADVRPKIHKRSLKSQKSNLDSILKMMPGDIVLWTWEKPADESIVRLSEFGTPVETNASKTVLDIIPK